MSTLADLAAALATGRVQVIDLTHTLSSDFPVMVLPPEMGQCAPFRKVEVSAYDHRGPAWRWNEITMNEHTGTHFDAPSHWITGKDVPNGSTDSIPVAAFVGPVVVIDFTREAAADEDALLTVDHLRAWEERHGRILSDSWVFLRTDWSRRKGAAYLNLREDGPHSPGPSAEAIAFLVQERGIRGFGTETVGTDAGQAGHLDPPYPAHATLHGAGRYGLQCMCNLDLLPPTGAIICAAPLKIENGSGSPLRVLALVEREGGEG